LAIIGIHCSFPGLLAIFEWILAYIQYKFTPNNIYKDWCCLGMLCCFWIWANFLAKTLTTTEKYFVHQKGSDQGPKSTQPSNLNWNPKLSLQILNQIPTRPVIDRFHDSSIPPRSVLKVQKVCQNLRKYEGER